MSPTLEQIENAFQPAREVGDPDRFAGRTEYIEDCHLALLGAGASIAVVGNRGIGKTSLARQIGALASGNAELLDRLEIPYDRKLDFLTTYYACGSSIKTIDDLLERLLTIPECLGDWIYDIQNARKEVVSYSPEISAKLFGAGFSLGGEKSEEVGVEAAVRSHPIDVIFTNVCSAIVSEGVAGDGILVIVDEFDQIDDPSGMAALIKAMATNVPRVKFCLVGVAQDIQKLMKEHESTDRIFSGSIIQLPSMPPRELTEIVRIAENSIDRKITFGTDATTKLVQLAQGHPYMVHLIGKYALRQAFRDGEAIVTAAMIDTTLSTVAERRADPILESRYRTAITSSPQRETVLRALAKTADSVGESWTTNAYKVALDKGVDNASQYVGQLVADEYGSELEKTRDRYYRFKDSLFMAYVLARPRQYLAV